MMNSICESCKYAFYYSKGVHPGCNYINVTGNTRDCAPGDGCTRYESGTPKELARERRDKAVTRAIKERNRKKKSSGDKPKNTIRREERKQMKKLTEENKREIITLRASGMKVTEIAQKFDVDRTSIYNVLKDYKEHGENAFTAATDTEKEPATAATETGSEQETCIDIPANIIPETEENVKSSHKFSNLAAKAIWNEINELRDEAAALEEREAQIEEMISDNKDWLRSTDELLMYVKAQIDSLLADYEAVMGGTA